MSFAPAFVAALQVFALLLGSRSVLAQWNEDFRKCAKNTDPDPAIQYCTKAIESGQVAKDDLAVAFYQRGRAYARKADYDRATQDYDQAISLDPKYAFAIYSRGWAYYRKKQYDRAIQDYDEAIRLDPDYINAYNDRGLAYNEKKDYDRAIQDFDRAIRLNPNYALAFNNRGNIYRRKSDYERAIQDYDEAIRINPKYSTPNTGKAFALFYLGRFGAAQDYFSKAVENQPKNEYLPIWLYLAKARLGQDGRSGLAAHSTRLKPEEWPAPIVNLYLGNAKIETILEAAKSSDPKKDLEQRCEAYFYLGQLALIRGERAEAIKLFKATLDTGVTNFYEYYGAEAELKRLGQ